MYTLHIYHAQPTSGQIPESHGTKIILDEPIPRNLSLDQVDAIFWSEAVSLADALCNSLPGGTLDRLMAELLRRKASNFIVPLFTTEKKL